VSPGRPNAKANYGKTGIRKVIHVTESVQLNTRALQRDGYTMRGITVELEKRATASVRPTSSQKGPMSCWQMNSLTSKSRSFAIYWRDPPRI
jgi:hypothetical protein